MITTFKHLFNPNYGLQTCMVLGSLFSTAVCLAQVSYETLTFLERDGHSHVTYATTRSDADVDSYTVFLDKTENLADYLYINPNRYEFDNSNPDHNLLRFPQGDYAIINQGDFINSTAPERSKVQIDADGIYRLRTWDGRKQDNGHYGIWNTPHPFARFAAAWVFPQPFEVVSYRTNVPGEWVQRGNTLAFFAHEANNLTFDISYRHVIPPEFLALQEKLKAYESVELEQHEQGLTVIMRNTILFESGSATMSQHGLQLLADVVESLSDTGEYRAVVEGHTDDVPIRGRLAERYRTNWELSAHRALAVVHALADQGVAEGQLEARAFGAHQPRVPNDSDDQRSHNRRIELSIEKTE